GGAVRHLYGVGEDITLGALARQTALGVEPEMLRGRSVLLRTADQLPAALALIELDGLARRIVLCPPDLAAEHLSGIIRTAEIDAIVSDPGMTLPGAEGVVHVAVSRPGSARRVAVEGRPAERTEWVLLTSGTTGVPKLVVHTLATLTGAFAAAPAQPRTVWSTFYDIRRYGGLQVFLRAMLGGGSLVLSSAGEAVGDFLTRADACGVTHISGTPSHWRRAVMSPARNFAPRYVRLSGEIADQAVLDRLQTVYPQSQIAHAFASTEAGVAFEVRDGLAGFPASLIAVAGGDVELRIEDGSLHIRSNRAALGYLRTTVVPLTDPEGFVDTGDMVERRGERYRFAGRRDGVINVGGQKIHPEEVEAVINDHPAVRLSRVRARRNPMTGSIVVAEVIAGATGADERSVERDILNHCRHSLAPHKVPALIRFVPSLEIATSGKLLRDHA